MCETKILDRSHAPIHEGAPNFLFPEASSRKLSSGIPLYCLPDLSQPIVSISLVFTDGSVNENISGISQFAMRLLSRGTKRFSALEFADELDTLGASLHCGSGWDCSKVDLYTLSDYLEKAVELMSDAVLHPLFDSKEIALLQRQKIAELQQILSESDQLASLAASQTIYRGHPYGHNRNGTFESVQLITAETALNRYREISQSSCFFIVAGNCSPENAEILLSKYFAELSANIVAKDTLTIEPIHKRQIVIVDKPDCTQATLRLGTLSVGHSHHDFASIQLISSALGGSLNSRLNNILREEKGYTYGAFCFQVVKKRAASLNITASVNHDKAGESVQIILNEIEKLRCEQIPDKEFSRTRQYLLGSFARSIETPQQTLHFVQTIKLYGLPDTYYTNFFKQVANLTSKEVFFVQQARFISNEWNIIAVGNAQELTEQLISFGAPRIISSADLCKHDNLS